MATFKRGFKIVNQWGAEADAEEVTTKTFNQIVILATHRSEMANGEPYTLKMFDARNGRITDELIISVVRSV